MTDCTVKAVSKIDSIERDHIVSIKGSENMSTLSDGSSALVVGDDLSRASLIQLLNITKAQCMILQVTDDKDVVVVHITQGLSDFLGICAQVDGKIVESIGEWTDWHGLDKRSLVHFLVALKSHLVSLSSIVDDPDIALYAPFSIKGSTACVPVKITSMDSTENGAASNPLYIVAVEYANCVAPINTIGDSVKEAVGGGHFAMDPLTGEFSMSDTLLSAMGLRRGCGMKEFVSAVSESDGPGMEFQFGELMKRKKDSINLQFSYKKGSDVRFMRLSAQFVPWTREESSKVLGVSPDTPQSLRGIIQGFTLDNSKEVDEQELLQGQKHLLELAEKQANLGHWFVPGETLAAGDGRIHWSQMTYRIHGEDPLTYEPLLSQGIHYYHPDDRDSVSAAIQDAITNKSGFKFQLRLVRKDGSIRHVRSTGHVQVHEDGETIKGIFGIFHDVTDWVESEEKSRINATLLDATLHSMTSGVIILNMNGGETLMNDTAKRMFGVRSLEELKSWHEEDPRYGLMVANKMKMTEDTDGNPLKLDLVDDLQFGAQALDDAESDASAVKEFLIVRKNAPEMVCESKFEDIITPDTGECLGRVCIIHDITTSRQSLNEIYQAKEAAEKANMAKVHFIATVSHELRTPLNGIMGMSDVLRTTDMSQDQKMMVDTIYQSSKSLALIINDILDYSKAGAGHLELEIMPHDMRSLVSGLYNLHLYSVQKGVELATHVDDSVPDTVYIDSTRLMQIFNNLLVNAAKFTEKGSISVNVTMANPVRDFTDQDSDLSTSTSTASDDSILYVRVKDTGVGIAEAMHSQIFQPFAQENSSVTRKYGGTGLGLAICKQLVSAMGGRIWFDSKKGEGTTFHFTIDISQSASLKRSHMMPGHRKGYDTNRFRALKVLVAEDNRINQKVIEKYLISFNVDDFEIVGDGAQAVERCRQTEYDLILMDVHMPVMDGFEATRQIRMLENAKKTYIIALTAMASSNDRDQCEQSGMDQHIPKPVHREDLGRVLQSAYRTYVQKTGMKRNTTLARSASTRSMP
eukprot:Clim_evm23s34 gene=Clim_evmTU23s34